MDKKNQYLSMRIKPVLKNDFYNFCSKSGISVSAAVNQLALKSIEKGSIPFTIHVINYDLKKSGETCRISIPSSYELKIGRAHV